MSKTSLLINNDLWRVLPEVIKASKHTSAAFAYFGQDGAKLLPLKNGDCLVVDMSPATVKAGTTNPHEIEKLIKRGIRVFTRQNLHAKIVISDKKVLVGSANVSKNSRDILDEAAILTDDSATLRRAKEFLSRICVEPVLPGYLSKCKEMYRPPHFSGKRTSTVKHSQQAVHAKLWIVNLVDYVSIPDSETEQFEKSEEAAQALLKEERFSTLDTFHWSYKPKMADELEVGDLIIQCIRHKDKSISLSPPARLICVDHYVRSTKGKERYLFHLEVPKHGQNMDWKKFQKALNTILDKQIRWPRTMAIRDTQKADDLLRLWTLKGRVSRK